MVGIRGSGGQGVGGIKRWWGSRGGGALKGGGSLGWWGPRGGGVKEWVRV